MGSVRELRASDQAIEDVAFDLAKCGPHRDEDLGDLGPEDRRSRRLALNPLVARVRRAHAT